LNKFIRFRVQSTMCGNCGPNSLLAQEKSGPLFCSNCIATDDERTISNSHQRTKFKTLHPILSYENQKGVQTDVIEVDVEIEPPKVIVKSVEQSTIQVTDEENVSDHQWKDEKIGKTMSCVDASPNNVDFDRPSCIDSDCQKGEDNHFPITNRVSPSINRKEGLVIKEARTSTISLSEIGLASPVSSTNQQESKKFDGCKPLTANLQELVDDGEYKPIENVNECQLSSHRKKSLNEADEHQSPENSCDNSSTSSKSDGSNNKECLCKPLTANLQELVDEGEYKPIENVNQCQLSSHRKKSLNEADEHQSPDNSCGNSSISSKSGGSNQFDKECLIPNKQKASLYTKTVEDTQEKVGNKDIKLSNVMPMSDQSHSPSENIKEQPVNSRKSSDEIESYEVRSPISRICNSNLEAKRRAVLSSASVSATDLFARHESLSVHDIFSTIIDDEIPITHDYLKPSILSTKTEFLLMTEDFMKGSTSDTEEISSSSSEKSPVTDRNAVSTNSSLGVSSMTSLDQDYLKNGRESGKEGNISPILENGHFNKEPFHTTSALNEPSSNLLKSDTPFSDHQNHKAENVAAHKDKPAEESSWFSPLYGVMGKLI